MSMKKYTFLFLLAAASVTAHAQLVASNPVVTTVPSPVIENGGVVITLHTHRGNKGLATYHQDSVYIYTGATIKGVGNWDSTQGNPWGSQKAALKTTRVDDSTYSFNIPNLHTFYNIPTSATIDSISVLFNTTASGPAGRDTGDNNIFIKVNPAPTGVAGVTNKGFSVVLSPNPFVNNLEAVFTNTSAVTTSVSITAMNGQVVLAKNFGTLQNGHVSVATDQLAAGVYIATFRAGDAVISQRITKQ